MLSKQMGRGLCLAMLVSWSPLASSNDQETLTLQGEVTAESHHTYVEIPFELPPGVDRLTVSLDYDRSQGTVLDLGLLDPQRLRGWSGGNKRHVTVSETDATASYLVGPLPAGKWRLLLGVPNIREGVSTQYEAHVTMSRGRDAFTFPFTAPSSAEPLRSGPGWYRGDLHSHTGHSDGACTPHGTRIPCPLVHTLQAAGQRELDFIAVAEHNTRSHMQGLRELQGDYPQMLLLPAQELTTFYGHANVIGSTGFVDFRITDGSADTMLQRAQAIGGLTIINHPGLPSDERCMGCGWSAETDYALVDAVEVVNGGVLNQTDGQVRSPLSGIPFWESLLSRGHRLTAIGASDNHDPAIMPGEPGALGHPATVVHAGSLSQAALMAGIRSGRVFVDVTGSGEGRLDIRAGTSRETVFMGADLTVRADEKVDISVSAIATAGATIRGWLNGRELTPVATEQMNDGSLLAEYQFTHDGSRAWFRAEVIDAEGRIILISNPVYLNYD